MAGIKRWRIKLLGYGKENQNLGTMLQKIPEILDKNTRFIGDEMRRTMIRKIDVFKWAPSALIAGLHVRKAKGEASYFVTAEAEHSKAMEEGVTPRWLHKDMISANGKTVGQWAKEKGIPLKKNKWLFVGGPNSRIKQGASRNQFFGISFDETIKRKLPEKTLEEIEKTFLK